MPTGAQDKPDASAKTDRRLWAVYRREVRNSVYFSAIFVSAAIVTKAVTNFFVAPASAPAYAAICAPLVAAGLIIAGTVRHSGRRYVIQFGMAAGFLPLLATGVGVALEPRLAAVGIAIIGLVPLAFAIFIPLERRTHVTWLVAADLLLGGIVVVLTISGADAVVRAALIASLSISTCLSMAANEFQIRRRRQMDGQLLAVRGLYGRLKEHELDLRRQDEFLFMQQETLVVQQAELLRLNEELETIARLDALTGLGNRLRLNEDLAGLAGRIERAGGTAGLLLLDLDRFKRLNDTAGHLAGDVALQGVAEALRKTSRVGDGVYRYGGEEFLVLLHDCDQSGLRAAGQRYLTAIEAAGMAHPDNKPYQVVTASAGVTELSQANCDDVDSALHDADEALYAAKDRGRNCLEVHVRPGLAGVVPMQRRRAAS